MKKIAVYIAISALAICAAVSLTAANSGSLGQITIDSFQFAPQNLTVKAGATVTWTNKDDVPHTVVSTTKKFRSGVLNTDGKFSFTFNNPGTYEYFCSVHPQMTGKVIVQ